MNDATPAIWTTETTRVVKTGSWRVALPAYVNAPAPCHNACPVDGDIAVWIKAIENHNDRDAWLTLVENNPFPAVTGRICHRPCENTCNRGQRDAPIAIRCLERFVGDRALEEDWQFTAAPITREEKIAIVGGGPAGLAAAYHLRRNGYAVTIFEARPQLGGVLRYGIPPYRLPREILEAEIARVLRLGIDVRPDKRLDTQEDFENLRSEFAAVYLATGAGVPKRLPQLDYSQPWVIDSATFLELTHARQQAHCGERVVVIGGGSAAFDVARTARRHGSEVTLLSLESEPMLPAQSDEVVEARDEGVILETGAMLQKVSDRAPQGLKLACIRVDFDAAAAAEDFRIKPRPGTEFTLSADTIVSAIGQDPDSSGLQDFLEFEASLLCIDEQLKTSLDGYFAGGDLATMQRFATVAFGGGKRAATAIHRSLTSGHVAPRPQAQPEVSIDVINTQYHPQAGRATAPLSPAVERQSSFDEVEHPLSIAAVLAESRRCFSCGNCTLCDNCFYFCPDMAIKREDGGYSVDGDFCKGCGLCVRECPTGSIVMRQEKR